MSKGNELVFPQDISSTGPFGGLTKRELFAAMAMQGIYFSEQYKNRADVAEKAVEQADALLEELEK